MPLVQLLIVIVIIGVLGYLVNNFIPMQDSIKKLFNVVLVIIVVVMLIYALFAFLSPLGSFQFGPRIR